MKNYYVDLLPPTRYILLVYFVHLLFYSLIANGPFARWCHFTTTTRVVQCFALLCKLGLLLCETSLGLPDSYMKRKTIWILVVLKLCHLANGLLIGKILYIRFGPLEIVKSRGGFCFTCKSVFSRLKCVHIFWWLFTWTVQFDYIKIIWNCRLLLL